MLTEAQKIEISNNIKDFFEFKDDYIFNRPILGELNFEILRNDYDVIYKILNKFKNKNYILIFPNQSIDLSKRLRSLLEVMAIIKGFRLSEGNKANERADLINRFTDQVYNISVVIGPILAYLDVVDPSPNENERVEKLIIDLESYALEKRKEADKVYKALSDTLSAAKDSSAIIGSLPFSELFKSKENYYKSAASKWLLATVGFTILTIIFAIISFIYLLNYPLADSSTLAIYNVLSSKLILFAVLIGGTIWSGRIYKALKHQEAVNSHRATAIQTFQSFISATEDEGTKQAVLLETTRAIFAHTDTGMIPNSEAGGSDTKIIELLKSVPGNH